MQAFFACFLLLYTRTEIGYTEGNEKQRKKTAGDHDGLIKSPVIGNSLYYEKLNDKDLEDFLEHVDSCEECYEELEIYYTVHYTIARLDEDEADQVYNVKKALQNRLEESRFYIWRTKVSGSTAWGSWYWRAASGCNP